MFKEPIKNSFTPTFDSWTTNRRTVNTGLDYELKIGSSSVFNKLKGLIAAPRSEARAILPNTADNKAIFDHLYVGNYFVEINGVRYPRDANDFDYTKNDYIKQYRDLKEFFPEFVGEPILCVFLNYTDMEIFF